MKNITKTTFFSSALFVLFANIQVWTQDASPAAERKSWRTTVYEAITSPSGLLMAAAAVLIPVGEAIISHSPPQKWISGGRSILRPSPRVYSDPTTTLLAGRLMRVLGWGSLTLGTGLTAMGSSKSALLKLLALVAFFPLGLKAASLADIYSYRN